MDEMLLITNANMNQQSGDVVLVTRRAKEFFNIYDVKTTCIIVKGGNSGKNNTEVEYKDISTKNEINRYIISNKPKVIIFYGNRSLLFVSYIKKILEKQNFTCKLVIDLQGALEEGIEHSNGFEYIKNYARYIVRKRLLSKALKKADGAFVVSDEMKKYCYSYLAPEKINNFKVYKIRCGINDIISKEQKLEWRKMIRNGWGIDNDTIVMVYSGYRNKWQKIDRIIKMFKEFDSKLEKVFFAFYSNIDEDFKNELKKAFPKGNYELKFLNFEEYYKYLSACDVGFLVRESNVTNRVAFPNKFSDYINSGLMVATNSSLPEPYSLLEKSYIDFIDIENMGYEDIINKILGRQNDLLSFYKETEELCDKELLYSTQVQGTRLFD